MKHKKSIIILACILVLAVGAVAGVLFLRHEKTQSRSIQTLDSRVQQIDQEQTFFESEQEKVIAAQEKALTALEKKVDQQNKIRDESSAKHEEAIFALEEKLNRIDAMQAIMEKDDSYEYKYNCLYGDGYNVLVIGNSITVHPKTEYWWAERGMAASRDDKDYVHLIEKQLHESRENVNIKAVQFRSWEIQYIDRKDEYSLIDRYLNDGIDWIIVQLGENVTDTTTFEADYVALLLHLHEAVPNAKLLTIGSVWKNETIDSIKQRVSEGLGIAYVDLAEIQDDPKYQAGLGTTVLGEDGKKHLIGHEGVSKHPGDPGMEYIAEKVMMVIRQFDGSI